MLYFQCDRSREFAGEGDPIDSTHQLGVVWEVVAATETRLDGDGGGRRKRLQGIGRHSQLQTMALPLIRASCSQCDCGSGHNVSSSDGGWRGRQGERVHNITLTQHTGSCNNNEYQNTDNSHYTTIHLRTTHFFRAAVYVFSLPASLLQSCHPSLS